MQILNGPITKMQKRHLAFFSKLLKSTRLLSWNQRIYKGQSLC